MIALFIIAWVLCAVITCGVMMHVDPDEWADDPTLCMTICIVGWWFFAVWGIGSLVIYSVMKQLSKIGLFVAGFLDKLMDKKDEKGGISF